MGAPTGKTGWTAPWGGICGTIIGTTGYAPALWFSQ